MDCIPHRISPNFFDANSPKDFKAAFVFCMLPHKTSSHRESLTA